VLFVSSNGFDVAGAKHFGFKVAWIRRGGSAPLPPGPLGPAQMYRLLRGNPETLGYLQDYTVAALTAAFGRPPTFVRRGRRLTTSDRPTGRARMSCPDA
jgi:2-haloacid dehalogenase